jgi:hypothetical protein
MKNVSVVVGDRGPSPGMVIEPGEIITVSLIVTCAADVMTANKTSPGTRHNLGIIWLTQTARMWEDIAMLQVHNTCTAGIQQKEQEMR